MNQPETWSVCPPSPDAGLSPVPSVPSILCRVRHYFFPVMPLGLDQTSQPVCISGLSSNQPSLFSSFITSLFSCPPLSSLPPREESSSLCCLLKLAFLFLSCQLHPSPSILPLVFHLYTEKDSYSYSVYKRLETGHPDLMLGEQVWIGRDSCGSLICALSALWRKALCL